MKTLKVFMLMTLAVVSVLSLSSCKDDEKDKLTGFWIRENSSYDEFYYFSKKGCGFCGYLNEDGSAPRIYDMFTEYKIENGHLMIMWYGDEGYYDDKGLVYIENKTFTFDDYTYVWAADKYPYEVVFGSQVEPGYDPAGWWAANGD